MKQMTKWLKLNLSRIKQQIHVKERVSKAGGHSVQSLIKYLRPVASGQPKPLGSVTHVTGLSGLWGRTRLSPLLIYIQYLVDIFIGLKRAYISIAPALAFAFALPQDA